MASYWIRSGAGGAGTGADWTNAYVSVAAAETAGRNLSGNIYYVADDHTEPNVAANKTFTGPASGLPLILISADHTDAGAIPAYLTGTTPQLSSLGGAYDLTLDGSFALFGIRMGSGKNIQFAADTNEFFVSNSCKIALAANGIFYPGGAADGNCVIEGMTIDLSADGTSARSNAVIGSFSRGSVTFSKLGFINAGYRTGTIFAPSTGMQEWRISGCDFSGFTNATPCETFFLGGWAKVEVSNCITASTYTLNSGQMESGGRFIATNVHSSDAPHSVALNTVGGALTTSTAIYRTGGAQIGGTSCSWLITTTANCSEACHFHTPWIYGTLASTGSKTFTIAITNDSASLTDAEAWIEVETLDTSGSGQWTLHTDQRATITTTAAAQASDSSTWNGSGPSFTYKKKLEATVTIGQTGQYRARVAIGKASIASSAYFYVCPKVTVS